jgi:hypothetical protein
VFSDTWVHWSVFSFLVNFCTVVTKKIPVRSVWMHFLEKMCKSCHILRGNKSEAAILRQWVLDVARTKQGPKKILFYQLTSTHIWLIPLVDDHKSTYWQNWKKKPWDW